MISTTPFKLQWLCLETGISPMLHRLVFNSHIQEILFQFPRQLRIQAHISILRPSWNFDVYLKGMYVSAHPYQNIIYHIFSTTCHFFSFLTILFTYMTLQLFFPLFFFFHTVSIPSPDSSGLCCLYRSQTYSNSSVSDSQVLGLQTWPSHVAVFFFFPLLS